MKDLQKLIEQAEAEFTKGQVAIYLELTPYKYLQFKKKELSFNEMEKAYELLKLLISQL